MNRKIGILFLILLNINLFAQNNYIFNILKSETGFIRQKYLTEDDEFYHFYYNKLSKNNLENFGRRPNDVQYSYYGGVKDSKIYIDIINLSDRTKDLSGFIDIYTNLFEESQEYYSIGESISPELYYQNNIYLGREMGKGYGRRLYFFDLSTKKRISIPGISEFDAIEAEPIDITNEKIHLIIDCKTKKIIYNFQNQKSWEVNYMTDSLSHQSFITNRLILAGKTKDNLPWQVFDFLNQKYLGDFNFNAEGETIIDMIFFDNLRKARVKTNKRGYYIVDTTPFRDYLKEKGYVFDERMGTIKTVMPIYLNANIQAPIQGQAKVGDEYYVSDKSGIQTEYKGKSDYWYQVWITPQNKGWVHGSVIELGEALPYVDPFIENQPRIIKLTASSTLTEDYDKNVYKPIKAFDGKEDTYWFEAAKGSGIGEYIEIELNKEITATKILFMPGCFEAKYWQLNNRVKQMTILLDDYKIKVGFKDIMKTHHITLPKTQTFKKAKFIIEDIYKTEKWDDTAISEIQFVNDQKEIKLGFGEYDKDLLVVPKN